RHRKPRQYFVELWRRESPMVASTMKPLGCSFALALTTLLVPTSNSAAMDVGVQGETYHVLVFGSQRPLINQPKYTHSFATFVRPVGDLCHPAGAWVEAFTISWLSATGDVRICALLPEYGRNFSLPETLQLVRSEEQRVSMWGPFQSPGTYTMRRCGRSVVS